MNLHQTNLSQVALKQMMLPYMSLRSPGASQTILWYTSRGMVCNMASDVQHGKIGWTENVARFSGREDSVGASDLVNDLLSTGQTSESISRNQGRGPLLAAEGRAAAGGWAGSVLRRFGRDLTAEARRGALDPCIGREEVMQRTLQILLRRTKNNPILIGEAGVGKTAVVEGIAQLLVSTSVPLG